MSRRQHTVMVDDDLWEWIEKRAELERRKVSDQIAIYLDAARERFEERAEIDG